MNTISEPHVCSIFFLIVLILTYLSRGETVFSKSYTVNLMGFLGLIFSSDIFHQIQGGGSWFLLGFSTIIVLSNQGYATDIPSFYILGVILDSKYHHPHA